MTQNIFLSLPFPTALHVPQSCYTLTLQMQSPIKSHVFRCSCKVIGSLPSSVELIGEFITDLLLGGGVCWPEEVGH